MEIRGGGGRERERKGHRERKKASFEIAAVASSRPTHNTSPRCCCYCRYQLAQKAMMVMKKTISS